MKTTKQKSLIYILCCIAFFLCFNASHTYAANAKPMEIKSIKDIEKPGVRIGVHTSLNVDGELKNRFPDCEIFRK